MGCLHSKKETSDLHPNVFRVVNVDEHGVYLCAGQLEITENDLILYREGRDSTVWPLHSLRRYGFEQGMFSFESGRRCETGEGIYAFKCRRASLLFRTLQQQIHLKNMINVHPVSRLTPSPQGRQTLQATVVHRSSIDNGQSTNIRPLINNNVTNIISETGVPRNVTQSPRSPSSADILEVMPLYPRSQGGTNQVTNVYQFRDFKREHNNNQNEVNIDNPHVYSNDLIRDLAILRNTLRQETALNTMREIEDETRFLESRYINEGVVANKPNSNPISPTLGVTKENNVLASGEQQPTLQKPQEPVRLYMNIAPNESNVSDSTKSDTVPTTPLTPKPLEYCNITMGSKPEINTYANLSLGELGDNVKNMKQSNLSSSEFSYKFSESEPISSLSPVEEIEVNYAVLDIETNKDSTNEGLWGENILSSTKQRGRIVSQCSLDKNTGTSNTVISPLAAQGYTTIDFDKTVALTSVAAGEEIDVGVEGSRKTRHNSCNIISISNSNDKSKNS